MRWLHRLFQKSRAEQQLDKELRFHLDRQIADYLAAGLSAEEARRRANLEFGGVDRVKEEVRDTRWETHLDNLFRDFRYALRSLRKDRRFALIAILALALGIGSATVVFSVVENVLFDPYPYKDVNRYAVFKIHDLQEPGPDSRAEFSVQEFLEYRAQNHVFEDVVGAYDAAFTYSDHKSTESIPGAYVTTNAFQFYGMPALLGRGLTPADGELGAPLVFVMNYKIWKGRFNGDSEILGKSFILNGVSRTLVGIMPPRFQAYGMRIWVPLSLRPGADGMTDLGDLKIHLLITGRLKPGVTLPAAAADIGVTAARLANLYPADYPEKFVVLTQSLNDFVMGDFKGTLLALLAAVGLLLLIACSNVANLLLSRATVREKEIALRASLGATRGRLVRQFLVESFTLALSACLLGCIFAYFGLKAVVSTIPQGPLPDEAVISLNPVVLLFAILLTLLTTLLCGLAPAIHALRKDLQPRLATTGKGPGAGSRHGTLRSAFVVVQIALSIVLLCGAGLMLRSFFALTHVSVGFRPQSLLYVQLFFPRGRYDTPEQEKVFFSRLLPRVKAIPGVIAATEAITVPPLWYSQSEVTVPGTTHLEHWSALVELCSEDYFQTLDVAIVRGRLLSATDIDSARKVVVVNQTLARKFFGSEDPIGRKIKFNDFDQFPHAPHGAYFEIIGVVTDFRNSGLRNPTAPEAFLPYSNVGLGVGFVLAKTAVVPDAVLPSLRQEVWAVEPDAAVLRSGSLQSFLQENAYLEPRFDLFTTSAFAGMGLLLVIIGVFSVTAYAVSLQTHEFGIRMALGAQHGDVLAMVLRQGLMLIAGGAVIGVLASFALTRLLTRKVWGVSATDPWTFATVVTIVVSAGLAACLLPARRAMRVDPMIALRCE